VSPDPDPFSGPNPFEGLPMFGDLARMFQSQGPVNWDVARQTATWVATEGRSEPNVDPGRRVELEELARVADLHVAEATGLAPRAGEVAVTPVTRAGWAAESLGAYRPFLERLAGALEQARPEAVEPDEPTQLLGDLGRLVGPVLLGLQSGFMLGHLARHSFGQHDVPLPRPPGGILLVPANIDAFAAEWSVERADMAMWVCLVEIAHQRVLGLDHVRQRLTELVEGYVSGFQIDADALESSFGSLDPRDPEALRQTLGNPETLLGALRTPAQDEVLAQLATLLAAVEGYVDHVGAGVGRRLVGGFAQLTEALRRRRAEATDGERFAARLLGLELGRDHRERGRAFVAGVVERAGEAGLARLWRSARELPTPAELEAPGLWLARIDLDDPPPGAPPGPDQA